MRWEYAALELLHTGRGHSWVLTKNRSEVRRNFRQDGKGVRKGTTGLLFQLSEVEGDALDLVNMAAAEGWEMTGQLPLCYRSPGGYQGNDSSGYNTCSMMRRRIE